MQNHLKAYLAGVGLFLVVLLIATTIDKNFYFNVGNQTASAFDPTTIPNADIASGFAWNDNVGWINFGTSTERVAGRVYVSDDKLYGYAWGENIGWISMNCENDDTCGTSSYYVTQTNSNGTLTGFAWGENVGWINFAPAGGGVTVSTSTSGTNTFSGYAWGENIGWISFSGTGYGVTTTWTKSGGSSGGGGIPSTICYYEYSAWTACINNEQTRTVTPDPRIGCSNASEPLVQACTLPTTPITVSISPATASIQVGDSVAFTATVVGTTSDVIWSIKEEALAGTISAIGDLSGLFTASNATGTFHIIAKVENDQTISASSTIIVNPREVTLPIGITIDPKEITVFAKQSILFKSFITNSDNKNTTWIVSEEGGGTIDDATGLYTAPSIAGIFHIIARPLADISKSDIATVDVRLKALATSTLPAEEGGIPSEEVVRHTTVDNSSNSSTNDSILGYFDVSQVITENIINLGTTTTLVYLAVKEVMESEVGSVVTNTVTTAGVVGGGIAASGVFALGGITTADLLFLPFRLWGLLMSALGLKKRNRPWGTVYDSVTKQPIDPAYVTIKSVSGKEEITSITDLDGRYGFLLSPGKYTITANKTNYTFPSKKLANHTTDVLYKDLYFGEKIDIETANALINKDIPLDPVKFDWNEFVKGEKKLMKFYSAREKVMRKITDRVFRVGFVVSLFSLFLVSAPYNLVIVALYILLTFLRRFGLKQKALGVLAEKNGNPLSFAIVRIFSSDINVEITSKVANKIGRYYCLVPKGKYYVKIEKKNNDESYSLVHTSEVFAAENGIINKNFVV